MILISFRFLLDESIIQINHINNTLFIYNSASKNGGAIKWTGRRPLYTNSTFLNNSAPYGDIEASYPINLMLKVKKKTDSNNKSPEEIIYSSYQTNDIMTLNNLISGGDFDYVMEFQVVDINNVTVNTLDGGL